MAIRASRRRTNPAGTNTTVWEAGLDENPIDRRTALDALTEIRSQRVVIAEDHIMVYRGTVRNGVVVLEPEVQLPEGSEVRVEPVEPASRKTLADQLGDLIGSVSDLPTDMARQHDHYLHGAPKR